MGYRTESPVTVGGEVALAPQKEKAWVAGEEGEQQTGCRLSRHVAQRLESRCPYRYQMNYLLNSLKHKDSD